MKRNIIYIILLLSIIGIAFISQQRYTSLEDKYDQLAYALQTAEDQIKSQTENSLKPGQVVFLRESLENVGFYPDYSIHQESVEYLGIPAFGPLAHLRPNSINQSASLYFIEALDHQLVRVAIEGVLPKWMLEDERVINESDAAYQYVLEDSLLYLEPDNEMVANPFVFKGAIVRIEATYEEWCFVTMMKQVDANMIYKGWLKSDQLGFYDNFDSNIGLEVEFVLDSETVFATILEETDDTFILLLPGASVKEISKNDIKPFVKD